ncbi:hypothetical protein LguiB_035603 [Lonicera macranthoides]
MMMTLEGAVYKFPSLKIIKNPNPTNRSPTSLRFRTSVSTSIVSSSSSSSSSSSQEPSSLGHITRPDFPILHQEVNGSKLVYLDNAATSQKPAAVLDALRNYYESYNSNVHRGVHFLSARATDAYELARKKVATFINASESSEIVFTRNATEAINLVAYSWGHANLRPGDEVVTTIAEHHSAIVPWQIVAEKTGAILKFASLTQDEVPDAGYLREIISKKTKLVVVHHISNMLASVLPVDDIVLWAHEVGAKVLIDACQSVPHMVVDVKNLNADFLVASSHKMCGPTGVGFLYAKKELLSAMPPFLGGGEMISDVFLDYSTYAEPPSRQVPNLLLNLEIIYESRCLVYLPAIDYLSGIGMQKIHDYEVELANYLYESLSSVPGVRIYGPAPSETSTAMYCNCKIEDVKPLDLNVVLVQLSSVAIGNGHTLSQPFCEILGFSSSSRKNLDKYNFKNKIDSKVRGLRGSIYKFVSA